VGNVQPAMQRFITLTMTLVLAAGVIAGCGGDEQEATGHDHPTGATDLVVRASVGGGLVPVDFAVGQLPAVSVYGDGTVVVPGAIIEIYPGPALPSVQTFTISEDALQFLLGEAERAGLLGPQLDYGMPPIADAATTTFTVVTGGERHDVAVYALGTEGTISAGPLDLTEEQQARRRAASDFATVLFGLETYLAGSQVVEGSSDYAPSAMAVYATGYEGSPDLPQPTRAWPAGSLQGGEPAGAGFTCRVVDGDALASALPAIREANQLTPWTVDGAEYHLVFRPLLPDETSCADPTS